MSVAASAAAPDQWGRVDEEGTVWVRTSAGERAVGSYPGAAPEQALAYFARKYVELVGQVDLHERRLLTTDINAKEAVAGVERLREAVAQARAVGDLESLAARVERLSILAEERRAAADQARDRARAASRDAKERLVAEAESLAQSTSWKAAGDRLRELVEEWKSAPRLDRRADDELWKRFAAARSAFDKRRRVHFAELDGQRQQVRARKEALVAEAEALAGSTDWAATAQRYRDLLQEWKAAGRADKSTDDQLWARFRGAQDGFFAARSAIFAERDAGLRGNLEQKEALATEAEQILPVTSLRDARRALRSVRERWEAVGHVPRDARDRVEGRMRRVEEAVREAEQGEWRRTNPEARRRAEETVAALQASIGQLEARAERARVAGQERKAAEAAEAAAARRTWLVQAEKALAEFSR